MGAVKCHPERKLFLCSGIQQLADCFYTDPALRPGVYGLLVGCLAASPLIQSLAQLNWGCSSMVLLRWQSKYQIFLHIIYLSFIL